MLAREHASWNRGYVFEITPAGRKVWEFASPEFDSQKRDVRRAIYRGSNPSGQTFSFPRLLKAN